MLCYIYNCWVIPLLTFFPYRTADNESAWFYVECAVDAAYVLDLLLIKPRVMYLEDGFWVRNTKSLRQKYISSITFKVTIVLITKNLHNNYIRRFNYFKM